MQKRSHTLLASALLQSRQGFCARRFELAFLFGSFQPDCNPLSYLKGSLHAKKLGGHNYTNSRPYITSRILALQRRQTQWTMWQYYTLGKLTHYLADAFTYPHNDTFPNTMLDHHRYESDLRLYMARYLACQHPRLLNGCQTLPDAIDDLHRQYLSGASATDRDTQYILRATELLMAGCRPVA